MLPLIQTGGGSTTPIVGSISQFNPAADGSTDDSAVFTTAQSTYNEIWLTPNKQYAIGTNTSLSASLKFTAGAQIVVKTGVTLTLTGLIQAPLNTIFILQGTGKVVLGSKNGTYDVYPEWWGAVGDNTTDDTTAIQNAINAVSGAGLGYMTTESSTPPSGIGCVVLGAKVYKVTSGLTVAASFVRIRGQGMRASILMCNSATADILTVAGTGTSNTTGAVWVHFSDFAVMRNVAPSGTPSGFVWKNALWCFGERLESWDSMRGFLINPVGSVQHINLSFCQAVGGNQTGTNTASASGFYINGGVNSSIVTDCVVASNGIGFNLQTAVDFILTRPNCATAGTGINITGAGSSDIQILDPVIEGGSASLNIQTVNPASGKIVIRGGYFHGTSDLNIVLANASNVEIIGGDCPAGGTNGTVYFDGGSHDNLISGLFISVVAGSGTAMGITIDGTTGGAGAARNVISNCIFQGPSANHGATALRCINGAVHNTFVGNSISGFWTTGISLDATSNNNCVVGNTVDPTNVTTPISDAGTGSTKLNQTT